MKATRDRLRNLRVNSTKPERQDHGGKHITVVTELELRKLYRLGGQVMESTNTGMDVIFATRLKDGQKCVIKTRKRSNSFKSDTEEQEWRATTEFQLNMPVVGTLCEFYEVLETPSCYYVVMECVPGHDLFEQMVNGRLKHVDAREIVRQILEGLEAMHGAKRIHKDLKIENVVVDMNSPSKKGKECCSPVGAKIIDFDTVQHWEPTSPKAKDVMGTDGYIAPEAYGGDYSPASDVYATGVIMYKALTGKFPHRMELFDDEPGENWVGSSAMRRIQARLKKQTINFSYYPLDKCPEACELVKAMLSYDHHLRPSAHEALKDKWFRMDPKDLK